jgi:hypothetical protein
VKWRTISDAFPKDRKKCDMNSVPWSEVTWDGTPCLENTWRTNRRARSREVMVSWVGMNIACLDRRSIMMRMAVKLDESGRCSMKSIEIELQGFSGMGNCFSNPYGLCLRTLAQPQEVQDLI